MPGKTIENFWKFPSGGIGDGQFEPDSFVISGQSQIHGQQHMDLNNKFRADDDVGPSSFREVCVIVDTLERILSFWTRDLDGYKYYYAPSVLDRA